MVTANRNIILALVAGLLQFLTTSCLGGQTGHPDSGSCSTINEAADADWRGLTVRQLGQAFEGKRSATLSWFEEPDESSQTIPIAFEDSLEITIRYDGAAGTLRDCSLDIPVSVHVATTSSAIADEGVGTLSFDNEMRPLRATFTFDGAVVSMNGMLTESAASSTAQGFFKTRTKAAPGASAAFR